MAPFVNAEILRASSLPPNPNFVEPERVNHGSPLRLTGHPMNGQPMDLEGWSGMQTEVIHIHTIVCSLVLHVGPALSSVVYISCTPRHSDREKVLT